MTKSNTSTKKPQKVAIIMSTYNGEKYLEEQLDSLLNQTYPSIDIYIRDDGSKDGTVGILQRYAKKHKNIHFEKGKNLGFAHSFLKVLANTDGYDYYAFCDQDDVWLDFKIQRAIDHLREYPDDRPLLYGASWDFCDAELNFREQYVTPKCIGSFIVSTTECLIIGTCMVINQVTRKILLQADPSKIYAHDWFTYMICSAMGAIIYDPTSVMKYRRTGDNASPSGFSFLQLQIYRIKNFLFGPQLPRISRQNHHFDELFYQDLKPADQKTLDVLMRKNRFRKALYPKRWRRSWFDELSLRVLFLLGKM